MQVILFGQLAEYAGSNLVSLRGIKDTDGLVKEMNKLYPAMQQLHYRIAVDKKIITANTILSDNNNIALLPPFSGG
ncbi:MAG: MoaD/ThiS family protein [Chitinophagaceae bacterium]